MYSLYIEFTSSGEKVRGRVTHHYKLSRDSGHRELSTVRNSGKHKGKPTIGAWAALLLRCLGRRAVSPWLLPTFLVYGNPSVRALITLFLTRECVVVITEDKRPDGLGAGCGRWPLGGERCAPSRLPLGG